MLKKVVISILSPIESFKPILYLDTQSSAKKRNELLKYLENYINLNGLRGIKLFEVDGRNFGKKLIKKERS